ncbi:ABC transporter permease [candidate division KSB1 bacterium]
MLKNYFKIAFRNLIRHRLYSFLNIAGLAVGIAACILILLYIQDELSYDTHHENAENIYRISAGAELANQPMFHFAPTSHIVGPMLNELYPEITGYTRIENYGSRRVVRYNDRSFYEDRFLWADSTLFSVFNLPLSKGNPGTALVAPNSVVITGEIAAKYFGDEDPMGKNLIVHSDTEYTITGVLEPIPYTTYIRPDFIGSISTSDYQPSENVSSDLLSNFNFQTFLILEDGVSVQEFEAKLESFVDEYAGEILESLGGWFRYELQPLTDIHLHSNYDWELDATSDIAYVYLFSGIGLFILLIACLNFMNLTTARSANRAKEVGLRKVVGAYRAQLIVQFIGESLLLAVIALGVAMLIVSVSLPYFNVIADKELTFNVVNNPVLLTGLLGLLAFIGIIGGSYPAFFLSSFRPVQVLRGTIQRGAKSTAMRIALVSLQFAVSITLIISSLITNDQLHYLRAKPLGYDKSNVVWFLLRAEETRNKYEAIKQELLEHPNILQVSASGNLPLGQSSDTVHHPVGAPEDFTVHSTIHLADEDFIDLYNMEIVSGRNFSKEFATDFENAAILNETAVSVFGFGDDPIGREVEFFTSAETREKKRIIGVVRDYHFKSLHEEITPLLIYNSFPWGVYDTISARISPDNVTETVDFLKEKWTEFDNQYPFEYGFVDDEYDELYRAEERLGRLFEIFTALAIIIGCLGLFGLASFTAEQRTKEIGIRKTFGASAPSVIALLIKEFTKWVMISNVIAVPAGFLIMDNWLQNYAYRIEIGFAPFVFAAVIALLIAVLTVGYQAVRAALSNPVNALRYE